MSRKDDRIAELEHQLLTEFSHSVELGRLVDGLAVESDDRMAEMLRTQAAIKAAIDDLRVLDQVPAGHLFAAIGEIVGSLRAVLV